jgi:aspartate aminotransferase
MPQISSKGRTMPESPIRKLVPFAEEARSRGVRVIHLNIGQPDIPTPPQVEEAIHKVHIPVLEYTHSAGLAELRAGFAAYYQKRGLAVEPKDVLVTTGGSEALLFVFGSIMDPGDEVIIPEPFYANYNSFATNAGVVVVPVNSSIAKGFALPPVAEFEKLITPRTKAILLCNPGNPTGYLYTREELEALRDLALKHDLFIVADEVYREFTYDGRKHISVLELKGLEQHAIVVDSVSKRYSMCRARIGMVVSRNAELMATALKFAQARLSPPTYAQLASLAALETGDQYFEDVIQEYDRRRKTLVEGLNRIPGVYCPNPSGAFYCVAELPVYDADAFCAWMLKEFSHNGETVMMAPASGFYSKPALGRSQVRLAYVLKEEELRKAVTILEAGLKAYPGKAL